MNIDMVILNQSIKTEQNYATWILTALVFMLKIKIFMKTLLTVLKNGFTHQTTAKMIKDRFQYIRTRKISRKKDKLGAKIMK